MFVAVITKITTRTKLLGRHPTTLNVVHFFSYTAIKLNVLLF